MGVGPMELGILIIFLIIIAMVIRRVKQRRNINSTNNDGDIPQLLMNLGGEDILVPLDEYLYQALVDLDDADELVEKLLENKVAKILLNNGADVDAKNNEGKTPLHIAEQKNTHEAVVVLREHGSN